MKKQLILLLLSLSITAFSQTSKLDIGVIGGPGFTLLYGNDVFKPVGLHLAPSGYSGVSLQYTFNSYLSLYTDFSFERKGDRGRVSYTDDQGNVIGNIPYSFQLNYLTIPVLLKAGVGKKVHVYCIAGPYVSALLNAELHSSQPTLASANYINRDYSSNLTRIDLGMSVGIGMAVPFAKQFAFTCEIRNNIGLYNISRYQTYNNQPDKNFSSFLLLGFTYNVGRKEKSKS
jgi:hypothetical protein